MNGGGLLIVESPDLLTLFVGGAVIQLS